MKIGFNQANDRFCAGHSVMRDLELCEQYGFDCIDIQSECLDRDLESGAVTLEELGAWFQSHHLKMLSYNAGSPPPARKSARTPSPSCAKW